jgi:cytochrome c2
VRRLVAGSLDLFQYSDAFKKSKTVWTEETLHRWLADTDNLPPQRTAEA